MTDISDEVALRGAIECEQALMAMCRQLLADHPVEVVALGLTEVYVCVFQASGLTRGQASAQLQGLAERVREGSV